MWDKKVKRAALPAPWNEYAKDEEKQRLATIERRLAVKIATENELLAERRKIMARCIKRMRRKEGKS